MADVEQEIRARLLAHAGTAALVGTRVYPVKLPQTPTYPAITYYRVNTERVSAMGADRPDVRAIIRVSCWDDGSDGYSGSKALATQVRAALERYSVSPGTYVPIQDIYFENEFDLYDDDAQVFHVVCSFEVVYDEA